MSIFIGVLEAFGIGASIALFLAGCLGFFASVNALCSIRNDVKRIADALEGDDDEDAPQ